MPRASSLLKKGTGTSHTPPFRGLCIVGLGASPLFQQAANPLPKGEGTRFWVYRHALHLFHCKCLAVARCGLWCGLWFATLGETFLAKSICRRVFCITLPAWLH